MRDTEHAEKSVEHAEFNADSRKYDKTLENVLDNSVQLMQ